MNLKIGFDKEDETAYLCLGDECCYLDSFLTIWVDDNDSEIPSPFKTLDDAVDFLKIVKKLLEAIHGDFER